MDNTSLICNFYMVTLKEGNGGGGGKKQASYTKIANFCPQTAFPSLVLFWSIHSTKQKEGCN